MAIDAPLVRRKATSVLEALHRLRDLASLTPAEWATQETARLATERLLERIVGRMIDINFHLRVESGRAPPRDYHESFIILAELGVVSAEDAARLARAAGLRDRLAHDYDAVDATKVHAAAVAALEEVPRYLRGVEAHCEAGARE